MYEGSFLGTLADIHEWMNKQTSGSGDGVSLSMGILLGNMEGAPLPGTPRERWIFWGWDVEGPMDGCLCRGPVGEPGEGSVDKELWEREWEEGSGNGAFLFTGALLGEPGSVKEGSGYGRGSMDRELWEMIEGSSRNGASLFLKRLTVEGLKGGLLTWYPGLWKEGSQDRHLYSWGLSWATWSGLVYRGLWEMAERGLRWGVSVYGSLAGEPG